MAESFEYDETTEQRTITITIPNSSNVSKQSIEEAIKEAIENDAQTQQHFDRGYAAYGGEGE